jgi:hypothetical protein
MSGSGQKLTFRAEQLMSAFPSTADIEPAGNSLLIAEKKQDRGERP